VTSLFGTKPYFFSSLRINLSAARRPQLHRPPKRLGSPSPWPHPPPNRSARAGGPAGLAALEARNAAERHAQLRQRPQRLRPHPAPLRAGPGSGGTTARSSQLDNEIIFLCEDDEDDANEISPTIQFILPEEGDTNEA
jgi:hypothetical protein